jgi:hypothetical protein
MDNVLSFVGKTLSRPKAFIALELPADKQTAPRVLRAVLPYSTGTALGSHACVALSSVPANSDSKTMVGQRQSSVHIRNWRVYGYAILLVAEKAINAMSSRITHKLWDDKKK